MRWLFWMLLVFTLAIGVSMLANENHGYVLIIRPPYRFTFSLNFLIVTIALSFILLHLILRLVQYIKHLPTSVKLYKENQRIKLSYAALSEALRALIEGRYALAEKAASKVIASSDDATLGTLIAARASHKLHQKNQREYYLAESERLAPHAALARLLLQAESLLDDRQYNGVIKTVQKIEKTESDHPPALRLLLKAQLHLKQWEQALFTCERLEKKGAIEFWYAKEVAQNAHIALIERQIPHLDQLILYWKKLSTEYQQNPKLISTMVGALLKSQGGEQAAEIIGMHLTKRWDSELAGLFGQCVTSNPQKQLQQAEFWLLSHQHDAHLLFTLGQLCLRMNLWGKAESYLEASTSLQKTPLALANLAKLYEQLGKAHLANQYYKMCTEIMATEFNHYSVD